MLVMSQLVISLAEACIGPICCLSLCSVFKYSILNRLVHVGWFVCHSLLFMPCIAASPRFLLVTWLTSSTHGGAAAPKCVVSVAAHYALCCGRLFSSDRVETSAAAAVAVIMRFSEGTAVNLDTHTHTCTHQSFLSYPTGRKHDCRKPRRSRPLTLLACRASGLWRRWRGWEGRGAEGRGGNVRGTS